MTTRVCRYPKEEIAQRGDEIYYCVIHPVVYPQFKNKFVIIDIETGEWEIDDDALTAGDRLLARLPDAQCWLVKVGKRAIHHLYTKRATHETKDHSRPCLSQAQRNL